MCEKNLKFLGISGYSYGFCLFFFPVRVGPIMYGSVSGHGLWFVKESFKNPFSLLSYLNNLKFFSNTLRVNGLNNRIDHLRSHERASGNLT